MIVTVTGGARSGKSSFAEKWCMKHSDSAVYIATAQAFDEEMRQRILLHKEQRNKEEYPWQTIEEPLRLVRLLSDYSDVSAGGNPPFILIDCMTLWLSNVLLAASAEEDSPQAIHAYISGEIDSLVAAVGTYPGIIVIVTNEVGSGIVPEYHLGRLYRDFAGILNRKLAAISDQVFLVTAGIPIELKSREYKL